MKRPCIYCGKIFDRLHPDGVRYSTTRLCISCWNKSRQGSGKQRKDWVRRAKRGDFLEE